MIYCLDYAQNKIVAGLRSGIIIWCTVRKKCIRKLEVNSGSIYCVKITGDLIFSGGKNREIKIFNINTGDCLRSLVDKHINSVLSLSIHSGILVSCSSSDNNSSPKRQAQVLLWKIEDIFHTLNPFSDLVSLTIAQRLIQNVLYNCYVVDSDEEFFVANLSHNMIIFNIHTSTISAINGQEVNLDSKPVDITYLKLNSQHNLLISGFKNGTIKIWDLKNFTCLRTNRIHTGQIVCIRCDENYLLAASYEYVWINFWFLKNNIRLFLLSKYASGLYVFNLIRLKDHNELDPIIQCFKQEGKDLFTFYFDKSQIVLGLKNSIIACYEPNLGHENC